MGKRMWLSLFILSGVLSVGAVVGNINPFEYIGNKAIAVIANEQEEPKPEVKFGEPFNIEQCLPGFDATGKEVSDRVIIYFGDALKNKDTGSVVDINGNSIVPKGYKYSFHNSKEDADSGKNAFVQNSLTITKPKVGERTIWLRVYPVVTGEKPNISSFTLTLKNDECDLQGRLVKLPDLYTCADDKGYGVFNLSKITNSLYYGQKTVVLSINGQEISENLSAYKAKNNTEVKVDIELFGTKEKASRTFRLYAEGFEFNPQEISIVVNQSKEEGGKEFGLFDLNSIKKDLVKPEDNADFYSFSFYSTKVDAEGGVNAIGTPEKYEAVHGTIVYARAINNLTQGFCVKAGKEITLKVMEKPYIPLLSDLAECTNELLEKSIPLTEQTLKIADGRKIVTEEESKEEGFDPTDKFTLEYFNSKDDADKNQNKIVGVEINVKLNEAKQVWVRLSDLNKKSFNVTMFYVSLGYYGLKTEPNTINDRIKEYYEYESDLVGHKYTVNLRANDAYYIGKLKTDEYGPSLNPEGAKLTVAYYKSDTDAKDDINRMVEDSITKYEMKMGGKSPLIYARVIMKEGFDCKAENFSSFYATLGTRPSIEYIPKENRPSTNPLYLCRDGNGVIEPVVLQFKNVSKYPVVITWQEEVKNGCVDKNGKKYDCFLNIPDVKKDTLKVGEIATLERIIAGKYRATVEFEVQPFKDKPFDGAMSDYIYTEVWTVNAPPVLVVGNADATGMINSMEIDEKGETEVVLGVVGLNGELTSDGYEFAIDNGGYQLSTRFYNVPIGQHIARARNTTTGCTAIAEFSVFGYPKYFTPNGDGYNDTWNIPGLKGHSEARIYIYDKSGRLLKQLSPYTEGWDGTWNGKQMPSTDYWFTVEFVNDYKAPNERNGRKVSYKGHFSLKR